ncbi:Cysteine-rich with EGF-like domain protein 1 [Portunus trituberculatus]|uniref:Cysteine-rich with EGF-like domain protein 1 n=1 Tax=Portunus trituberculatus TaxID=210409 RepID=A0A5B7JNZ4_PORTR|nr:Cysteine-rich with EGF-like domain protein 1 [Portunus trituberculatus]
MKAEVSLMVVIGLGCLVSRVRLDAAKPSGETKDSDKNKESLRATKLPPCAACRVLTESFNKGIESTARGKYEGGDSAWEEEKKLSYKKSEVRLIEIQEKMCKDVERGQKQVRQHY